MSQSNHILVIFFRGDRVFAIWISLIIVFDISVDFDRPKNECFRSKKVICADLQLLSSTVKLKLLSVFIEIHVKVGDYLRLDWL
jgi:hypothetical protein